MGKELSLLDLIIVLLKHKRKIVINFVVISVIALVIAMVAKKSFKSELVFIPRGHGGSELFSLIGNNLNADLIGGSTLSKRQYKALLLSRELREKIIKKFNLIEVYEKTEWPNPTDKTLQKLEENIIISEEEEGGLGITDIITFTITVIDGDSVRASEMANYMFSLLEEKVSYLNKDEYSQIVAFLSKNINNCSKKIDSLRIIAKKFQLSNHAYNIPSQVSMVLQAYGSIKAEIIALDNKISYAKSLQKAPYSGVKNMEQKKKILQRNLNKMEMTKKDDIFLGLAHSLDLSNEYIDINLEVETYTQLRLLLRQQIEQAKIKQSKNISPFYLVDVARPAEYKFKPKRVFIIIAIVFVYMTFFLSFIFLFHHYNKIRLENPERLHKTDRILMELNIKKK